MVVFILTMPLATHHKRYMAMALAKALPLTSCKDKRLVELGVRSMAKTYVLPAVVFRSC